MSSKVKYMDVEELYKKYPKVKREDVAKIQEWLVTQPHLPGVLDLEIAIFLRHCNGSIEETKEKLDRFYTCRSKMDFAFKNRDIAGEDMKLVDKLVYIFPLPKKTTEGYIVYMFKLKDPEFYNYPIGLKKLCFLHEIEMYENGPIEGVILLLDLAAVSVQHLLKINPHHLKQILYYALNALPHSIVQTHFINPVPFMHRLLSILKPLINDQTETLVHENVEGLYRYIAAEMMPNEYEGGKAGTMAELCDNYTKYLLQYRDYFLEEERTKRVNENLRPKESNNLDEIFGLENFKELDID